MVYVRLELFSDKSNYVLHVFLLYMPLAFEFSNQLFFVAINLFNILSWPRRRGRLRSAAERRFFGACFRSHHLLRQGDQEAQRSIANILSLVNRKIFGTVAPGRVVASRVGAAVEGGREMRAAVDDRGQPRATM